MGLGGYYGHYQGHWLSATAFLINSTANATVKASAAPPHPLSPVRDGAVRGVSPPPLGW